MEQELIISPNDERKYSQLTLQNQLQALIIHDQNTNISGACLEICVGWLDDPKEYEGIAHFLEHMLFMGSEKYPIQNDYSQFITLHSGSYNASTWLQSTKFYFSIENNAFLGALDRFAQFFIAPLFDPSCVEREMNAVESEFNLSLANDSSRHWEIFVNLSDPQSTFNRFGCGNLKTLNKPDIREQLIKFYDKYYCSSLMKLVVYTNQNLEETKLQVQNIFSAVPNKGKSKPLHLDNPFKQYGYQVEIVGVDHDDKLQLSFIVPNYSKQYQCQPQNYVSHILGHEGQNSLASFLKDEGLITELVSGFSRLNDSFCEFYIDITLTEEGFENYGKVVGFVFQQIEILKEKGVSREIFDELAEIKRLEFQFKEKSSSVLSYIEELSENMHKYPPQHVIYGEYAYDEFNPELLNDILRMLNADNVTIFLRSQEFDNEDSKEPFLIEPYCQTKYKKHPISNDLYSIIKNCRNLKGEKTNKKIDLFPLNTYLPKNLDIVPNQNDSRYPEIIFESDIIKCFHLNDKQFPACRASFGLQIYPDQDFVTDVNERVVFELWSKVFYSQFEEKIYNAECAGVSFNFRQAYNFFSFTAHGFSDSIVKVYHDLIQYLIDFHKHPKKYIKKHIYQVQFEDLQSQYDNYFMKSPYDLEGSYWKCMIYKYGKFMKEELSEVEVEYSELIRFTEKLIKKIKIQLYMHGNIGQAEAEKMCQFTQEEIQKVGQKNDSIYPLQIIKIPPQTTYKFEKLLKENQIEPNSGIRITFQGIQSADPVYGIYFDLLNQIIADPFENQLRTNEKLGYVASTRRSNRRGVHFFNFVIISETKSSAFLAERINAFLKDFLQNDFKKVDQESFNKVKESYYTDASQDYQNQKGKFQDFWNEILINQNDFAKKQKLRERIDSITLDSFLNFSQQLFQEGRRLEIHIVNQKHLDWELEHEERINETEWFEDIFAFK